LRNLPLGTNDIDVLDFVELFLADDEQTNLDEINDVYVSVNFRPAVTKKNWRMDCGVAAYDNTFGLPPFLPTRLRFEDIFTGFGFSKKASLPLTSIALSITFAATTCAIRLRRRYLMRSLQTCSSGEFTLQSLAWMISV
jgi:hypothetical protein